MRHSVTHVTLPSGAEGLFVDVPASDVVSIDIVFRAGDFLSPNGKFDTAHVMEHLVLGANERYPNARDYSREFSKYGAYNNAYTGDYHMGYEAECASSEAERILDLLCAAIESPLFTQKDFDAEIGNVREELKMRRNNDENELSLLLENAMGFIPKSFATRQKELNNVTLADIEQHYKLTHTSTNMRFVIAGPVAEYITKFSDRISSMPLTRGNALIELPDERPNSLPTPLLITNKNLDNVCYRWEAVLPLVKNHLERDSINAVYELLLNGLHSRVFGDLRERGLVYGIFGSLYDTANNTVSVMSGQVQGNNLLEVSRVINRELKRVADEGIDSIELEELKKRAIGEMQRSYQTVSQLNGWYRHPFIMRGELVRYSEFNGRIQKLTSATLQSAAQTLLQCSIQGLGIMHNASEIIDADAVQAALVS